MPKRPEAPVASPCQEAVAKRRAHENGKVGSAVEHEDSVDADVAVILRPPHSPEVFSQLGCVLRRGELVSFPTETVYGLGANGLDAQAVLKIFEAKGRPLTDPCILHVAAASDALPLLILNELERTVFDILTEACWPGPLSIVARAQPSVPREVTASTDFVAVRCPAHAVAQSLLAAAGVPLAAPSANRFGHISPTLPEHVFADLSHWRGLQILDGGPCRVGVESTVAKLDLPQRVLILRKGGATKQVLEAALAAGLASGRLRSRVAVEYPEPAPQSAPAHADETEAQQAPGMLLRHYAPSVPTVLLSVSPVADPHDSALTVPTTSSILVDFRHRLREHEALFSQVFELCGNSLDSSSSSIGLAEAAKEACSQLFATLRAAEAAAITSGAGLICIRDFSEDIHAEGCGGGFAEALQDRLYRSASGRKVRLCLDGSPHFSATAEVAQQI